MRLTPQGVPWRALSSERSVVPVSTACFERSSAIRSRIVESGRRGGRDMPGEYR